MATEIPPYGLRAYALLFTKYGTQEPFQQSALDWMVGESMKKKIFAVLLHSGWIQKQTHSTYRCIPPERVIKGLLEFKVPDIVSQAEKRYCFTGASAIEIWSDFSYVQRGIEKSPYFIKVLKKDQGYWKKFLNENNIPNYIGRGSTIGEYVILIPVTKLNVIEKEGVKVEPLPETIKMAHANEIYKYAHNYIQKKYGSPAA
ncbi:hypothetical protein HYU22_04080 [Candidatus Woesearchaeota archaeon]|nr:hypothetical protein [Candidatus Woesearchaeota archaeon]